jgi:hypothetical protein
VPLECGAARASRRRGDRLHGKGQGKADGDQAQGIAPGSVGVRIDAHSEGALPEQREEEPGDRNGKDVGDRLRGDQDLWRDSALRSSHGGRVHQPERNELRKKENESGDRKEEERVAEVGDTGRRLIGRRVRRVVHGRLQDRLALGQDRMDGGSILLASSLQVGRVMGGVEGACALRRCLPRQHRGGQKVGPPLGSRCGYGGVLCRVAHAFFVRVVGFAAELFGKGALPIVDFFAAFGLDLSSGLAAPALARPVFFSGATNLPR